MTSSNVPAPASSAAYLPDQIILYGVKINQKDEGKIPFLQYVLSLQVKEGATVKKPDEVAIAVIYGYAFEGHCYTLDRPKLMIFEYENNEPEASGCGFFGPDYRMWRISKKKELLELKTDVDLAEVLVLDMNMPGNRAPNTYGNHMALAHRNGRLNRGGGGTA